MATLNGVLGRIDVTRNWTRRRLESPRKFFKGSFRVKQIGKGRRLIIACPRGYVRIEGKRYANWDAKRGICRVGTRAQSIMTPRK